jgi:hypothetical protein
MVILSINSPTETSTVTETPDMGPPDEDFPVAYTGEAG